MSKLSQQLWSGLIFSLLLFQESFDETSARLEESRDSTDLLIEEIKDLGEKCELEKSEVEISFLKFMNEITDLSEDLEEREIILSHRLTENVELKEIMNQKDKEVRKLQKIVSKLTEDILDMKSVYLRCAMVSNLLNLSGDEN